jgi:hypothetical protein
MPVSSGELIKAVATHELDAGVISQSVWYWVYEGVSDQSYNDIMVGLVGKLQTLYALMNSVITDDSQLTDLVVNKWLYSFAEGWHTGALIGLDTLSSNFAGGTDAFPQAVAAVVTGFTQLPRVRSRKSIGGWLESAASDSTVLSTGLTALANFLGGWLQSLDLGGGELLVPVVPKTGGGWEYLLYGLVSGLMGSQRQRKPGIGI